MDCTVDSGATMIDLLRFNFARPPDAWWKRACGILDRGDLEANNSRDGVRGAGWIRKAVRVQSALRTGDSSSVLRQDRGIVLARNIYEGTGHEGQSRRWAIEARILARQSNAEIAKAQGCTRDVIAAYEALFFNVRQRLQSTDYIWCCVLGRGFTDDPDAWDLGLIWKSFAYAAGPHVLEDLMSQSLDGQWVNSADGTFPYFHDQAITTLDAKAAVAALTVPVNSRTMLNLIKSLVTYIKMDRRGRPSNRAADSAEANLEALLKQCAALSSP